MISLYHQSVMIQSVAQGGAAAPDLVDEDFEGTGTPSGWFAGFSANFDYSAAPLADAQSLFITKSSDDYAVWTGNGTNYNEVWGKFMFRTSALPTTFNQFFVTQDKDQSGDLFTIVLFADGRLSCDGIGIVYTVATMAANTTYYIWWHFVYGTPNGSSEIWFDTVNTRPSSSGDNHATGTVLPGDSTQFGILALISSGDGFDNTYDNVQVATFDFS